MTTFSAPSEAASDLRHRIQELRGQRVMLDAQLAELYGVDTRTLVQAVKRNPLRFPNDFMFQLTSAEFAALRSQFVISKPGRGGRRTSPFAFTEQGVAMLSSVLSSPRAIAANIEIMRTFVRIRQLTSGQDALAAQLRRVASELELLSERHDRLSATTRAQFRQVFEAIRALMTTPEAQGRPIGFVPPAERPKGR